MAPISRSFGTLYIDGRPAEPGVQLPQSAENPKIEIGNSDGRFIHWVVVGGLLVSRYDLVVGISWNALVHNALIESREITIDRLPYRIRLLRRGEDVEDLGEFKQYLRALGSPDNTAAPRKRVWLDDLGMEGDPFKPAAVRLRDGQYEMRVLNAGDRKNATWIPVLEPVQPELSDAQGEKIAIWTNTGEFVTGDLVEINDYDLLLSSGLCLSDDGSGHSPWVSNSGFCMAVDRKGIWSLQTYSKEAV